MQNCTLKYFLFVMKILNFQILYFLTIANLKKYCNLNFRCVEIFTLQNPIRNFKKHLKISKVMYINYWKALKKNYNFSFSYIKSIFKINFFLYFDIRTQKIQKVCFCITFYIFFNSFFFLIRKFFFNLLLFF